MLPFLSLSFCSYSNLSFVHLVATWRVRLFCVTDPQQYKYNTSQPFNDPAIMSAQLATMPQQQIHDNGFMNGPPLGMEQLTYGPPPGLGLGPGFPPGLVPAGPAALLQSQNALAAMAGRGGLEPNGSAHGEFHFQLFQGKLSQVRVPSAVLSVRKLYYRP